MWLKNFHGGLHYSVLEDMVLKPTNAYNIKTKLNIYSV